MDRFVPWDHDRSNQRRLKRYVATALGLAIGRTMRLERIGDGQSNLTYVLTYGKDQVILRRPPDGPLPPTSHDVLREFKVLSALSGGPVPVPRPLVACADREVIGSPFYLMSKVDAEPIRFRLPASLRRTRSSRTVVSDQAIDNLVALHRVVPAAVGLGDWAPPTGYMTRQFKRWQAQLELARCRDAADLDWLTGWLGERLPREGPGGSIVHGDYKLDNLLFDTSHSPALLAVVDWEMSTIGDPLSDLGWLVAFWRERDDDGPAVRILPRLTRLPGFASRLDLVHRYARQTPGGLPSLFEYVVFAHWKLAIILEGHWSRRVRTGHDEFGYGYLRLAGPRYWAWIRAAIQTGLRSGTPWLSRT